MGHLIDEFGKIDIYLFDQLLRGRILPGMRIFDAGFGSGRNLVYLLRNGWEVFGVDANAERVRAVRRLAAEAAPGTPPANFRHETLEQMSFPDAFADVVISCAVLHFARDDKQFHAMLDNTWRLLKPGGLLFCRLASRIGMENQARPISGRLYQLPDGSDRYLVDEALLTQLAESLGGTPADPLKTTVVQGQRSMTTWVLFRNHPDTVWDVTRQIAPHRTSG